MKVLALSADEGGCGQYRMYRPAEEARKLGVDIEVSHTVEVDATKDTTTGVTEVHAINSDADLIIIQRPLDHVYSSFIAQAKRQGIATIVELDDDFEAVSRLNAAHPALFGNKLSNANWVRKAAEQADLVTVSTPALARYALHGRYEVIRNCIPDSLFELPVKDFNFESPVIGWTGTVQTHPLDLQETKGAVAEVLSGSGLPFHVVGDGQFVQKHLRLAADTPFTASGWVDVDKYYEAMQSVDIGIVPLEMSSFNEAKSALKGMEMAALGIPFVASPTREYLRLEAYGVGKVAKGPGDWRRQLSRLISRPAETEKTAKQYRETIYNEFTYSKNAHQWISAWEQAISIRKSDLCSLAS